MHNEGFVLKDSMERCDVTAEGVEDPCVLLKVRVLIRVTVLLGTGGLSSDSLVPTVRVSLRVQAGLGSRPGITHRSEGEASTPVGH